MKNKNKRKVPKLTDEEYAKYIASITNGKEPIIPDEDSMNKQYSKD